MTHFYPDKQYGFIKCDEVKVTYGLDTFLSNLILSRFKVGSTVSFPLIVNKDGKPHARLLQGHARISGDNASMARVVSDSHIDELLGRRTHIHAKSFQKSPLVAPGQRVSSFINNSHIGKPSFEGPQFPRKNIEKNKTGQPRETKPRKAERRTERPRKLQRGRAWIERAGKKSPKAPGRLENAEGLKDVARRASLSHPGPVRRLQAGTLWASLGLTERL